MKLNFLYVDVLYNKKEKAKGDIYYSNNNKIKDLLVWIADKTKQEYRKKSCPDLNSHPASPKHFHNG